MTTVQAVEAYARALKLKELQMRDDAVLPEFPDHCAPYLHMNVQGMRPAEYWSTSVYDYQMCRAVQEAWRKGESGAEDDHAAWQANKAG